jgi:hypothetical protein
MEIYIPRLSWTIDGLGPMPSRRSTQLKIIVTSVLIERTFTHVKHVLAKGLTDNRIDQGILIRDQYRCTSIIPDHRQLPIDELTAGNSRLLTRLDNRRSSARGSAETWENFRVADIPLLLEILPKRRSHDRNWLKPDSCKHDGLVKSALFRH